MAYPSLVYYETIDEYRAHFNEYTAMSPSPRLTGSSFDFEKFVLNIAFLKAPLEIRLKIGFLHNER